MLTALAVALQFIEFPIPIMPPFIKLDFSDLPALVGAVMFGPLAGVVIQLLKNIIHFASSNSMFIGEISNFFLGATFAGTAGLIYKALTGTQGDGSSVFPKIKKTQQKPSPLCSGIIALVLAGAIGAVASGIIALPLNLYIIYPIYYKAVMPQGAILGMYQTLLPSVKSMAQAILIFNVPFTIVKSLISVAVTVAIYKPLTKIQKTI